MALDVGQVEELIIEEVYEDEIEPEDKELSRNDDNDMEEGEISGQEDLFQPARGIKARLGLKPSHRLGLPGSINTARLPDLLREIGATGTEALDPAFTERIEARAKRFNLKSSGYEITHPDFIDLYKSFNILEEEYSGKLAEGMKKFRMEAIQLSGLIPGTKAEDILEFFGDIVPATYEWVNNNTCNVIWALSPTAAKAMLTLSRPISNHKREDGESSDNDLINVHNLEDDAEMEEVIEEPDGKLANVPDEKKQIEQKRQRILKAFDGPVHSVIEYKDLECPPPSNEVWRYAKPGSRLGDAIFMRIPRLVQLRRPLGIDALPKDIGNSGGIWSSSHKRRVREAIQYERDAIVEYEKQKKYSGPVGKDPWGTIAQDWTKLSKGQPFDFAAELAVFRDLCNQRNALTRPQKVFTSELRSEAGFDLGAKDWDNPENFEVGIGAKVTRGFKRVRSFTYDSDSEDDGKFPASRLHGSKGDRWMEKLKKPRMTMVADEEESKISAKRRILKTAKRRLRVPGPFPTHVPGGFDSDEDNFAPVHAKRERFTLQVENSQFVPSAGSKLSLRLQNRLGNKPTVQSKVGKWTGGHESDDSLENAGGYGMRSEIGGKRFESMIIRVNRSPGHAGKSSDGEMDEDEEVQEVSAKSSKPMSVVHVKEETQSKIKNEFDEEQKRAARRREGNDKRYQDDPMKRYQGDSDERNREDSFKRRREAKQERERESRKMEVRRREDVSKPRSRTVDDGRRKVAASRKTVSAIKVEGSKKKIPIKIKKEKFSDDSSSSDSSDDDSTSSSSSSDSSSSSSTSSSSSDSSSSSSSSDSSSGEETTKKAGRKPVKKLSSVSERNRKSGKVTGDGKKSTTQEASSSDKLKDKLKEYLSKAKKK